MMLFQVYKEICLAVQITLHQLTCENQTTVSVLRTAVTCFDGTEQKGRYCALSHYYDEIAPKRPIAGSIRITSNDDQ